MKLLLSAWPPSCLLAGCNTIDGMGKDISKAGDTIEDAAKKSK